MASPHSLSTTPACRNAGRGAIASGVCGLLATGSLIGYLVSRSAEPATGILLNRLHDAGVVLQFALLIPFVYGLPSFLQLHTTAISKAALYTGLAAVSAVALCLLLVFPKWVSDILYMLPQGIFGAWLITINLRMKNIIANPLRWFGIIVGLGLAMVGLFPLGFAIFIDLSPLQVPAAPLQDFPETIANNILHQILFTGSILGVLPLPVWAILFGRKLLHPV